MGSTGWWKGGCYCSVAQDDKTWLEVIVLRGPCFSKSHLVSVLKPGGVWLVSQKSLLGVELSQGARGQSHATNVAVEACCIWPWLFNGKTPETSGMPPGSLRRKEGRIRGYGCRCCSNSTTLSLSFLICKMEIKICLAGLYCEDQIGWMKSVALNLDCTLKSHALGKYWCLGTGIKKKNSPRDCNVQPRLRTLELNKTEHSAGHTLGVQLFITLRKMEHKLFLLIREKKVDIKVFADIGFDRLVSGTMHHLGFDDSGGGEGRSSLW